MASSVFAAVPTLRLATSSFNCLSMAATLTAAAAAAAAAEKERKKKKKEEEEEGKNE
jgi:hypothetical protein